MHFRYDFKILVKIINLTKFIRYIGDELLINFIRHTFITRSLHQSRFHRLNDERQKLNENEV